MAVLVVLEGPEAGMHPGMCLELLDGHNTRSSVVHTLFAGCRAVLILGNGTTDPWD